MYLHNVMKGHTIEEKLFIEKITPALYFVRKTSAILDEDTSEQSIVSTTNPDKATRYSLREISEKLMKDYPDEQMTPRDLRMRITSDYIFIGTVLEMEPNEYDMHDKELLESVIVIQ